MAELLGCPPPCLLVVSEVGTAGGLVTMKFGVNELNIREEVFFWVVEHSY